jgi:hypothetical protein
MWWCGEVMIVLSGFEDDADAKCYPERTDVDAKIKNHLESMHVNISQINYRWSSWNLLLLWYTSNRPCMMSNP